MLMHKGRRPYDAVKSVSGRGTLHHAMHRCMAQQLSAHVGALVYLPRPHLLAGCQGAVHSCLIAADMLQELDPEAVDQCHLQFLHDRTHVKPVHLQSASSHLPLQQAHSSLPMG